MDLPTRDRESTVAVVHKRVLIVDDNRLSRSVLQELLALWGYDVEVAEHWQEDLAAAIARRPDVALVDVSLDDEDTLTVIRRIKTEAGSAVVAFSGWHYLERAAREAGADAFVLKPDVDALQTCLRSLPAPAARKADTHRG